MRKKAALLTLFLSLTVFTGSASAATYGFSDDNGLACYLFNSTSGPSPDQCGNRDGNWQGSLSSTTGIWQPQGLWDQNKSLGFDGDDYINVSDYGDGDKNITVAAWVKPNQITNEMIISKNKGGNGVPDGSFTFKVQDEFYNNADFRFGIYNTSGLINNIAGGQASTNTWTHVAGTFNGTNLSIYVNGELKNSTSINETRIQDTNVDVGIGRRQDNNVYFNGEIDEPRIYDDVKTPQEISNLYLTNSPDNDTVGTDTTAPKVTITHPDNKTYSSTSLELNGSFNESSTGKYNLDGGSNSSLGSSITSFSTTVSGLSDGKHTLTVYATDGAGNTGSSKVTFTVSTSGGGGGGSGAYGFGDDNCHAAFLFNESSSPSIDFCNNHDGVWNGDPASTTGYWRTHGLWDQNKSLSFDGNDYLDTGDDFADGDQNITLAAWVKPSSVNNDFIVSKNTGGNPSSSSSFGFRLVDGFGIEFILYDTNGDVHKANGGTNTAGAWYHAAVTYDGSTMKVYKNGTNVANKSVSFTIQDTTTTVAVGRRQDGNNYFNGNIDEVRIYDDAKNTSEIKNLYLTNSPDNDTVTTSSSSITLHSPSNTTYGTSSVDLKVSNTTEVTQWYQNLDNSGNTSFTPNKTFTGLAEDGHSLVVWANTGSGWEKRSVSFEVEADTPTVDLVSPKNKTYTLPDVKLELNVDELVDNYFYNLDSSGNTSFTPNITLKHLASGSHSLKVFVEDGSETVKKSVDFSVTRFDWILNSTAEWNNYLRAEKDVTFNNNSIFRSNGASKGLYNSTRRNFSNKKRAEYLRFTSNFNWNWTNHTQVIKDGLKSNSDSTHNPVPVNNGTASNPFWVMFTIDPGTAPGTNVDVFIRKGDMNWVKIADNIINDEVNAVCQNEESGEWLAYAGDSGTNVYNTTGDLTTGWNLVGTVNSTVSDVGCIWDSSKGEMHLYGEYIQSGDSSKSGEYISHEVSSNGKTGWVSKPNVVDTTGTDRDAGDPRMIEYGIYNILVYDYNQDAALEDIRMGVGTDYSNFVDRGYTLTNESVPGAQGGVGDMQIRFIDNNWYSYYETYNSSVFRSESLGLFKGGVEFNLRYDNDDDGSIDNETGFTSLKQNISFLDDRRYDGNYHYFDDRDNVTGYDFELQYRLTGTKTGGDASVRHSELVFSEQNVTETKGDNTPPTSSINVTSGSWYQQSALSVELTATDTSSSVQNVSAEVDNGGFSTTSGSSKTVTISGDGNHTLKFYAFDSKGNKETVQTEYILLDTENPDITYLGSTTTDQTGNSWVIVNVTRTDSVSSIASTTITFDGTDYNPDTCNADYCWKNITGLSDGDHEYNASTQDQAGNTNQTSSRTVTTGVQAPTIGGVTYNKWNLGGSVTEFLDFSISDSNSNVKNHSTFSSGSVSQFTNSTLRLDNPGNPFNELVRFADGSDLFSNPRAVNYTVITRHSAYTENKTGVVNTSQQTVNASTVVNVTGDCVSLELNYSQPAGLISEKKNGVSTTCKTGQQQVVGYWIVDHVQTQLFQHQQDNGKTSNTSTQYLKRVKQVKSTWSTAYSRLNVDAPATDGTCTNCSTRTVSVSGNGKANTTFGSRGDWIVNETSYSIAKVSQTVSYGSGITDNFTRRQNVSVANNRSSISLNVDLAPAIPTTDGCSVLNSTSKTVAAGATVNETFHKDCKPGTEKTHSTGKTLITNATKYTYNATTEVYTNLTDEVKHKYYVPVSRLTDWSNRNNTVKAKVDGNSTGVQIKEETTGGTDYAVLITYTNHTQSSKHDGDHYETLTYYVEDSSSSDGSSGGGGGGGGSVGGSGDTTIYSESPYNWSIVLLDSGWSDRFTIDTKRGDSFSREVRLVHRGDDEVTLDISCIGNQTCKWLSTSVQQVTFTPGGRNTTLVTINGTIPEDIERDTYTATMQVTDPAYNAEAAADVGVVQFDVEMEVNSITGMIGDWMQSLVEFIDSLLP